MDELPPHVIAALAGLVIGLAFGAVVQRTNFCAMGAVADVVVFGDWRRLRAWILAIAVAMLGARALVVAGAVDLEDSIYLGSRLGWAGAILGGLLFGIGMVLAGGCASRNLVRLGAGDLRAFVIVLLVGTSAVMALHGLSAPLRVELERVSALELADVGLDSQALTAVVQQASGASLDLEGIVAPAVALALLAFCLASPNFRSSPRNLLAGLALGLLVTAGWWATGVLAADNFEPTPLVSLSFVAPLGESLLYLMTFTGSRISFGVAVVGGVVLGAFAAAKAGGGFRLQTFEDRGDFLRSLLGALLMGFGGVSALGCTIGQGITGLSTLSLGSFLAFGSIVLGAVIGVRILARDAA